MNNSVNNSQQTNAYLSLWESLQPEFQRLFSTDIYRVWFKDLTFISGDQEAIRILAPTEFAALWIRDNYRTAMEKCAALKTGRNITIALDFPSNREEKPEEKKADDGVSKSDQKKINALRKFHESYPVNPKNTFANFVVGAGSQLAHATAVAVSCNPGKAYNPLFIYGATGLGKTHLMHAVAHAALERKPTMKIVYTSTEKFTNEFIRAVQENSLAKFRQTYRKIDMLLIDDIHFLSGKERIQEEFFHTFNELFEAQKQIFLCSDRSAAEISRLENRLVSRFQWGFVADIQAPDLETRMAILRKKAVAMNLELSDEVLQILARGVSSNVRRLEGALNRVAAYMSLTNRQIDESEVRKLLTDIFQEEAQKFIGIEEIQRCVAAHYKLTLADLLGKKRPASIAFPRQIAMYLSRLLTSHSLQRIGSEFGGRDHGTVIHACKTVENMIEQDAETKQTIEKLQRSLQ